MMKFRSTMIAMVTFSSWLAACGSQGPIEGEPAAQAFGPVADESLQIEVSQLADGTGTVEYRVTNVGTQPVSFLRWDTALDGVYSDLFEVRRAGSSVPYVGPNVVFAEPRAEHFQQLEPGESALRAVNLAAVYDMKHPGVYSVLPRQLSPALQANAPGSVSPARVEVYVTDEPSTVSVDDRHVTRSSSAGEVEKAVQPQCVETCEENCLSLPPAGIGLCQVNCPLDCNLRPSCSEAQDNALNASSSIARGLLDDGIAAVGSGNEYLEWFGVRTRPRTSFVSSLLSSARSDINELRQVCLAPGAVMFDSIPNGGCRGPGITVEFIAGTNGSQGQRVAYCPDFFAQSARGQAATVVHEASHHFGAEDIKVFIDNDLDGIPEASDTDGVLGEVLVNDPTTAANLAIDDPDAAIRSAVNYQNYALEF